MHFRDTGKAKPHPGWGGVSVCYSPTATAACGQERPINPALDGGCSGYGGTCARVEVEARYGFVDPLDF